MKCQNIRVHPILASEILVHSFFSFTLHPILLHYNIWNNMGRIQCQYWLCESSDFLLLFFDNFPDFFIIFLDFM